MKNKDFIDNNSRWFDNNINEIRMGFVGENIVRTKLEEAKIKYSQIDVLFEFKNQFYIGEIKTQERYLAPPFDGHGLPPNQAKLRMDFYNKTGIIPLLIILDLDDLNIYQAPLPDLMETNYYITKGKKRRIIFNLEYFKKTPSDNEERYNRTILPSLPSRHIRRSYYKGVKPNNKEL